VSNVASGRPAFGSRFNTGNIESSLLSRGFHYGTAPNSVVIGWNGGHAAVTLPDGTPVSSGESGRGVRVGGGGAYQSQFNHHMYLPVQAEEMYTTATVTELTDPAATPDAASDDSVPDSVLTDGVLADGVLTVTEATFAGPTGDQDPPMPRGAAEPVVVTPVVSQVAAP
jgi:hypothetical protein